MLVFQNVKHSGGNCATHSQNGLTHVTLMELGKTEMNDQVVDYFLTTKFIGNYECL